MDGFARRARSLFLPALLLAVVLPGAAAAQDGNPDAGGGAGIERPTISKRPAVQEAAPGRIIVGYEEDAGPQVRAGIRREEAVEKREELDLIDGEVVKVAEGRSVEAVIQDLEARPNVEYAVPDRLVYPTGYGDEPRFEELWGLHNTGQSILGRAGVPDMDVDALEASRVTQGSEEVVVAVIDDGVDFSHPDLAGRQWVNEDEVPDNNVDDDRNGYVDDVNGYDFANDDNTVHDELEDFHGTHVAGTIAASVNDRGVVGVAPNVRIMALKFLGPFGGTLSGAIKSLEYAKENGVRISNNSWGYVGEPDPALKEAIEASGMLFVASAGNEAINNDAGLSFPGFGGTIRAYPASFDSPNILSVAATNNRGELADFSNFGRKTVDVSAPGVDVLSTVPSTPPEPGMTLSTVDPTTGTQPGRAIVAGFGAEEISSTGDRASFFRNTFEALERSGEPVVIVDDDLSSVVQPAPEFGFFGFPDVAPVLSAAVRSATGVSPEVIEVGAGDGPNLARLKGKTVIWATGQAYFSGNPETDPSGEEFKNTLTFTDTSTLTRFLKGGGKLLITGMDAFYSDENTPFLDVLGIEVQSDYTTTAFDGEGGTAFEGESYALENRRYAISYFHDIVRPADARAASLGSGSTPEGYADYLSGTSMSAPHATGTAALAASEFRGLLDRPVALKKLVMERGAPAPATAGKTATGDMVNAAAAVRNTAPTVEPGGPKGSIKNRTPTIRATVLDLQSRLRKADIRLYLNDRRRQDFSYNAKTGALAYRSPRLSTKSHTVRVTATDPQGLSTTKTWSFRVRQP